MDDKKLIDFIIESNKIEGIFITPSNKEIDTYKKFLKLKEITLGDINKFVWTVAKKKPRFEHGRNVIVGNHVPLKGGPEVEEQLIKLLVEINNYLISCFDAHCQYETIHPYMDGNGRSGRIIWAWMRQHLGYNPFHLGFLHIFYYESLENSHE